MSGETDNDVSSWTTDTLRYHVERIFQLMQDQTDRRWTDERRAVDIALRAHDEALKVAASTSKEAITAALSAQKEATNVQAATLEQQRQAQNEWRGALNDVSMRAMPRAEAESAIQRVTEGMHEIRLLLQAALSRAEYEAARANDAQRLSDLATRVTQAEAMTRGSKENRTGLYAAIGAVGVLVTIVVVIANMIFR